MYSCEGKAEFSASFFQSSVTWFEKQPTFLIIINVENVAAYYF